MLMINLLLHFSQEVKFATQHEFVECLDTRYKISYNTCMIRRYSPSRSSKASKMSKSTTISRTKRKYKQGKGSFKSKPFKYRASRSHLKRRRQQIIQRFIRTSRILALGLAVLLIILLFINLSVGFVTGLKTGQSFSLVGFAIERIAPDNKLLGYDLTKLKNKVKSVFNFKSSTPIKQEPGYVVGMDKIPIFDGSTFVFAEMIEFPKKYGLTEDDLTPVYHFLSTGNSVYLLPLDQDFEQAVKFYKKVLKKDKWDHVLSVEYGQVEQLPGEYWVNPAQNKGLHIYTIDDDIWYEYISMEDAQVGLANKVRDLQKHKMMVLALTGDSLKADTDWKLAYPANWRTEARANDFFGVKEITFIQQDGTGRLELKPIKKYYFPSPDMEYKFLKQAASKYISNFKKQFPDRVKSWGKCEYSELTAAGGKAILTICYEENPSNKQRENNNQEEKAAFLFLVQPNTQLIYVLEGIDLENRDFFTYVKGNLRPR